MVACLFAGVGAWGAKVTVSPNPTYASELFGEGHGAPMYPTDLDAEMDGKQDGTPVVTLTIPQNVNGDASATPPVARVNHDGEAQITFTLSAGTFMSNVTGLMFDSNAGDENAGIAATGAVVEIVDGGTAGDSHFVIRVKAVGNNGRSGDNDQTISFKMPRLQGLDALAGANKLMPVKSIKLHVVSRVISGEFTDGKLSSKGPDPKAPGEDVIKSRDSLTLKVEASGAGGATKTIAIDDNAAKGLMAFKSVKEKNKAGYVEIATVTIMTQQVSKDAKAATPAKTVYKLQVGTQDPGDDADNPTTNDQNIYTAASPGNKTQYHPVFDLDGEMLDEGLRGNFMVNATGTRGLFNEDDVLFVDYDGNGKMGGSEGIATDTGMGSALSIDPDKSESFPDGVTGNFKVYYMPGGKMDINHGSMINLTAMVDYSDPSAINEAPGKSSTTMEFDGVTGEVKAYAIPHSTNGTGDKGNVRVRCEQPSAGATACRVFLECWDDMGMRGFGEAGMVAGNSLVKWTGADIETVTGMEPSTRHSCRILSKGMVSVQQLTRDGNSGTLVNNTYVGE